MQEINFEMLSHVKCAGANSKSSSGGSNKSGTNYNSDGTSYNDNNDVTISCCSGSFGPLNYNVPVWEFNYSEYLRDVASQPLPGAEELNAAVDRGMMTGGPL